MSSSDPESDPQLPTPGYDATFSPGLDDKYVCPVCLEALRDPLQTVCGHRFCKICLTRSTGQSLFGKCPLDQTLFDLSQVFEDNATRREVLSLTIRCDNYKDGCLWKGELRHRENHACECPEAKVDCINKCGHLCSRKSLQSHIIVCPLRRESCAKCGLSLLISELAKHHLLVCEKFLLTCTLCGEVELARENMARHIDVRAGDCPMVTIKCPYLALGCYFQEKRKNMRAHKVSSLTHHHDLVMIKLRQHEQQTMDLFDQFGQMTLAMKKQCGFIEEQNQTLRVNNACIRELRNEHDGSVLWQMMLPTDRSTSIFCPLMSIRSHDVDGVRVALAPSGGRTTSAADVRAGHSPSSPSLNIDHATRTNRRSFRGVCRVVLFSRTPIDEDFVGEFPFSLHADAGCPPTGEEGLSGFMSTDRLYDGPYARGAQVLAFVSIRPKAE